MTSHLDVVQFATSSNTGQVTFRNNNNLVCLSVNIDELDDMSVGKQSNSQLFSGDSKCVITFHEPANELIFVSTYRDTGAALTLLYDNVLPTSYLLMLNRTVNIRGANGTTNEVSVFQVNVTSRHGMINGSVEIGLIPCEFIMPDGTLCLIGDDYGARPVL